MFFVDRSDAGRRLAEKLTHERGEDVVVLGLPRGGVPVAFEVARELQAPLDVIVVRKLGVPYQPEFAMGAVGEGGVRVINEPALRMAAVSEQELAAVERRERATLESRALRFRGRRAAVELTGRTAVLVDDGIATGSTMRAACQVARARGARRVVVAVPVAAHQALSQLHGIADEVICLQTPHAFWAVGQWYGDFAQVSDAEVADLLDRAALAATPEQAELGAGCDDPPVRDEEITIPVRDVSLAGHLYVPEPARGVVLFAHGSGSSRFSPRNRHVADVLNRAGLGTLLFDLLAPGEELDRANVFDIELLAQRLGVVTHWVADQPGCANLPLGYFGASTGAAAALVAAAGPGTHITAVVSRGGRPDLAWDRLPYVHAATLLIVGGYDDEVLRLNREAQRRLRCENHLAVVAGATHLFEEPGTLQVAAELARDWFVAHLAARSAST